MAHILIVEDDRAISLLIRKGLEAVGYTCSSVFDGTSALKEIAQQDFDLILLDVMIPHTDGFQLIQEIQKEVPVIFLTARNAVHDRVKGLKLGAEDYIIKPFDMLEVLARIEKVLKRTQAIDDSFFLGDVRIDLSARLAYKDGVVVDFTPQEFSLIEALVRNRNIALSRERLLQHAWDWDYGGDTRTVDVHIHNIRKKLGWEKVIVTVYKLGYRLEAP